MGPPSVKSFFSRSKGSKQELGEVRVSDDDILATIDDIYLQAKSLLIKQKYNYVVEAFLYLTEYDILFKKIIASQITNIKGDFIEIQGVLNEDIMNFLVMIQSYFNSFRINLLSDLAESLYSEFNTAMNLVKTDVTRSMAMFNRTNDTMIFILNKLKEWHSRHMGDYFFDLLYDESKESFLELKLHTAKQLQKLIRKHLYSI